MASSTMINLRNIHPIAATAAILKDHRLAFNVPGTPFIEPSWASVKDETGSTVHGVLYKLTENDFARVCQSEGVPFAYRLHRCNVIPYIGNGRDAGSQASSKGIKTVSAFTLIAGKKEWRQSKDTPPSQAYLNVLKRGAKEFLLDESYVKYLESIESADTIFGDGIAEKMLQFVEFRKQ